jgi:hypothetical protein
MQAKHRTLSYLPLHLSLGAVVLLCCAVEAWFGRPELFGDDISYLDVTNMIRLGDWKAALNPLWSIGYPMLLAALRPLFPSGIRGELTAVFALNVLICLATWLAFVWFLHTAAKFIAARNATAPATPALSPFVLIAAACVFLVVELSLGRVSSVGPDQLVTCLFFAASALLLRFAPTHPSPTESASELSSDSASSSRQSSCRWPSSSSPPRCCPSAAACRVAPPSAPQEPSCCSHFPTPPQSPGPSAGRRSANPAR